MKIKLIRLPTFFQAWDINSSELNCSLLPPLGPALITGYLSERGFEIEQDDLNIKIFYERRYNGFLFDQEPFFDQTRIVNYCKDGQSDSGLDAIFQQLEEKCPVKGYEVILLSIQESLRNRSNVLFASAYAQYLKNKYQPFIMLGGFGVAVRLMYLEYDFPCIDFYIIGVGERVLETILKAKKEKRSPLSLDNVYYERNNRVLSADYRKIEKPVFNGLPMEYYRYRGMYSKYGADVKDIIDEFHHSQTLVMPFAMIKGCPHKCIFCSESNGKLDFIMDPTQAADALGELQDKYEPAGYFFMDNEINVSQKFAQIFCDAIIGKGLKIMWSDCARADFATKDILRQMKEAGCIRLIFGIETGSRKLLKYVRKEVSLEQLEAAIRWANELGIWTGIEIICGLPHETDQDIQETIDFLLRNKSYINRFYYNTFDLRAGSLLFHEPRKYGIEHIFDVNEVVSFAERKYSKNFTQYGFDEISGLRWEEKKKQTLVSYDKVVGALGGYEGFPTLEEEHFLFFLYKKYGYDLGRIQAIFRRVAQEKGEYRDRLRREKVLV